MEIPINPGSITMMIILAGAIFLAYGKYSYEKDLKNKKNKKYCKILVYVKYYALLCYIKLKQYNYDTFTSFK